MNYINHPDDNLNQVIQDLIDKHLAPVAEVPEATVRELVELFYAPAEFPSGKECERIAKEAGFDLSPRQIEPIRQQALSLHMRYVTRFAEPVYDPTVRNRPMDDYDPSF